MGKGKASGYTLKQADVPTILGMQKRGDRDHDIAAWFGVNQGRIAEAKDGKYGTAPPAATHVLPPKGPPGIKGRRLRTTVGKVFDLLTQKGAAASAEAIKMLQEAQERYDSNET
jgi:hypothetical protein